MKHFKWSAILEELQSELREAVRLSGACDPEDEKNNPHIWEVFDLQERIDFIEQGKYEEAYKLILADYGEEWFTDYMYPAPIDNKNVLEDFADTFHQENFIEHREGHIIRQAFWREDTIVVLSYEFGNNWFSFQILDQEEERKKKIEAFIQECIDEFTERLIVKHEGDHRYRFYWNPDW